MPDALPHSITQASSGELCRALFEQAAVGVAQIDTATGRFVRVNRRYCEIIGLNEQDMTATTFMAITHPDDLQPDLDNMEELKAGRRRDFSMEKRLFRSDGSTIWVNLTVSPMWSPGETPTSHLAIVEDITDRKQAEAKLLQFTRDLEQQVRQRAQESEESRRRLQAILDGTSDAVFVKDLRGRYLLLNRAAGEFVGKNPNQVMGQDDTFIFSPADALAVMDGDRKVMAAGETKTYEDVATTADGVQRTFLSTKGPLFDAQGHVVGLFGISRDITERKLAEAKIQQSETRFRRLFEEAYLGMCLMGADKTLLRVNRAFCSLVGYDEEELVGRTYAVYTHPDDLKANLAVTDRFLRGEIPGYQIEKRYIRKNGEVRWVNVSVSRIERDAVAQGGLLAIIEDITERKRVEQALQQLNATLEERVTQRTAELRDREVQLSNLVAHFPGCVARVDRQLRYRYASPTYEHWFGLKPQDVLGRTIAEVVGRESFEQARPAIERALMGERITFETSVVLVSGATQHVLVTLEPERDVDGSCRGFAVYAVDITERRKAEDALRASERFRAAVLDSLSAHVAVLDRSGTIVAVNRVWERSAEKNNPLGRYRVGVGANYVDVCRQAAPQQADIQPTLDGLCDVLSGRKNLFETEYSCLMPEGRRWFSMRVTPLGYSEGGAVVAHEDITELKRAEAAEARMMRAITQAGDIVAHLDAKGRFVYVNDVMCRLLGYSQNELLRMTVLDVDPQLTRERYRSLFEMVRERPYGPFETVVRRKDGSCFPAEVVLSRVDTDGMPLLLSIMRDLTARRTSERALKESDRRFRDLLHTVKLLAVVVGPEGRIQYCNPYYLELTGYQEEQVEGRDYVATFVPLEDQERIRSTFLPAIERETFPRHFENDILCHDGTRRTVSWANTVMRDPDGAVLGMASIGEDVTHRRQAEAALRLSEERFRLVAEATNDILWDWDLVTGQHWWSPNAKSKFGYDPVKEPSLEAWSSRLHPDDRERVTNRLHHIVLTPDGTPFVEEYRFLMRDGSYGFFQDKAQVFRDTQGRPVRMIGAMIDVTAAKQAYVTLQDAYARHQALSRELQVAAEQERRRLSRELHDEFGQLLGALKFDVSRIADDVQRARAVTPAMVSKKLRVVRKTVDRLFSSLREMVRGLRPAVLDELGLVPSLEALAHEVQEHSGLRCRFVADRDDLGKVFGPELESTIFRVTQELLTNVVRHADASVVRIDLNARDGWAQLTVRDNGRGMNQGRGVNKASVNGRGQFGLRGVRERAELLGGQVEILSQVDQGTMVTVRIPFVPPTDRSRAASGRKPGGTSTTRKRVTRGQAL